MIHDVDFEKRMMRAAAGKKRTAFHRDDAARNAAESAITDHMFALIKDFKPKNVACYYPIRSEVNVIPLARKLAGAGIPLALPCIVAKNTPLIFRKWVLRENAHPQEELIKGLWDIPEPAPESDYITPDLILVPLLAFDSHGYRLGYGGGFYDRTLQEKKYKTYTIGVAYGVQYVTRLPQAQYDQKTDAIMTENGLLKINANPAKRREKTL